VAVLAAIRPDDRDGSNLRQLTFEKKGFDFSPAFSPNGAMILFSHFRSTAGLDLVTMSPTGGHLTQVTRTSRSEYAATIQE
jgi:Tol biopolymer transport system component